MDRTGSWAQELIEAMDGIDNGVNQYPDTVTPRYRNHTDLASRIARLNPAWNDEATDPDVRGPARRLGPLVALRGCRAPPPPSLRRDSRPRAPLRLTSADACMVFGNPVGRPSS